MKKESTSASSIFMISFHGGTFGDFVCSMMSNDQNFYRQDITISETNGYNYPNPFEHYGLNLHYWTLPEISIDIAKRIDQDFAEKNLCFPTHWYGDISTVNLSRLIGVRLYVDERLTLLTFLLSWIKAMRKISSVDRWTTEFDEIKKNYPHLLDLVKKIEEKGHYHRFEKTCLQNGFKNYKDFITQQWSFHQKINSKKQLPNWIHINVCDLFFDDDFSSELQKKLSLNNPIEKLKCEIYHQKNLDLIEREFGIAYNYLRNDDFLSVLCDYIEETTKPIIPR